MNKVDGVVEGVWCRKICPSCKGEGKVVYDVTTTSTRKDECLRCSYKGVVDYLVPFDHFHLSGGRR